MDLIETAPTGADPSELYDLVADLGTYPGWLGLVVRAEPEPSEDDQDPAAWSVELGTRIGPFARSKRLRMVRVTADRPRRVCFERRENDGRDHAVWRLEADIEPGTTTGDDPDVGATLTMRLYYDGNRFAPILSPLLRDEIRKGRAELQRRYPVA